MEENKEVLTYITRLGLNKIDDTFRHKIYISYCLKDKDLIIDIAREFLKLENVIVCWINPNNYGLVNKEELDSILNEMQLAVYLVSDNYVKEENNFSYEYEYKYFRRKKTSALPILLDETILDEYTRKFGTIQYLVKDDNSVDFKQRLESFLKMHLIDEKLYKNATKAFDKRLFLSYRKIDKELVNELLDAIHKNKNCHDIAIWYDDFLIPGVRFDELIEKQLSNSSAFLLLTTPNINVGDNYIKTVEYPIAKKLEKTIFPVVVNNLDVDEKEINRNYEDFPKLISVNDIAEEVNKFFNNDKYKISKKNKFYMGLAYLYGINVERNNELAISFIEESSNDGNLAAKEFLANMYQVGNGVPIDYEKAFSLREELLNILRKKLDLSKWDENDDQYWKIVLDLVSSYSSARESDEKVSAFFKEQTELVKKYTFVNESKISKDADLRALRLLCEFFTKYAKFAIKIRDNDTNLSCVDVIEECVIHIQEYDNLSFDDVKILLQSYLFVYVYYEECPIEKEDIINNLELLSKLDLEETIPVIADIILDNQLLNYSTIYKCNEELFDFFEKYFVETSKNITLKECYQEEINIIFAFTLLLSLKTKKYSPTQKDIDFLKKFIQTNSKKKRYLYFINTLNVFFKFEVDKKEINKQLSEASFDGDVESQILSNIEDIQIVEKNFIDKKYDDVLKMIDVIKAKDKIGYFSVQNAGLLEIMSDVSLLCKNENRASSDVEIVFKKLGSFLNVQVPSLAMTRISLSIRYIRQLIELKCEEFNNFSEEEIIKTIDDDISYLKSITFDFLTNYLPALYISIVANYFADKHIAKNESKKLFDHVVELVKDSLNYFKENASDSLLPSLTNEMILVLIDGLFDLGYLDLEEYEKLYQSIRESLIKRSRQLNANDGYFLTKCAAKMKVFYLENNKSLDLAKLYDFYAATMNILINDSKPIIELTKEQTVAFYSIVGGDILARGNFRVAANIAKQVLSLEKDSDKIFEYIFSNISTLYPSDNIVMLKEVLEKDISNVGTFLCTFIGLDYSFYIQLINVVGAAIKYHSSQLLEGIHINMLNNSHTISISDYGKECLRFAICFEHLFSNKIDEFLVDFKNISSKDPNSFLVALYSKYFKELLTIKFDKEHSDIFNSIVEYMLSSAKQLVDTFFINCNGYALSFFDSVNEFIKQALPYFDEVDKNRSVLICKTFIDSLTSGAKNNPTLINSQNIKKDYEKSLYLLYNLSASRKMDLNLYQSAYEDFAIEKDYYSTNYVFNYQFANCLFKLDKKEEARELLKHYFLLWHNDEISLFDNMNNVNLFKMYSSLEEIKDDEHNRVSFYSALSKEKEIYLDKVVNENYNSELDYSSYPSFSDLIVSELMYRKEYKKAKEYVDRRFDIYNRFFPIEDYKELYKKMYSDYSKIYDYLGDENKAYEYHLLSK